MKWHRLTSLVSLLSLTFDDLYSVPWLLCSIIDQLPSRQLRYHSRWKDEIFVLVLLQAPVSCSSNCCCLLYVVVAVELKFWYSAVYMSRFMTRSALQWQKLITVDWHTLMVLQRTMRPSTARVSELVDPWSSQRTYHHPSHSVARKLLLISLLMEGRRLSWPEHTLGKQLAQDMLANDGSVIWMSALIWNFQVLSFNHLTSCSQ